MRNEVTIGANPKLNNLVMYRMVDDLPFIPYYYFNNNNEIITTDSYITVNYLEYYKDTESNRILMEQKRYHVKGTKSVNWFVGLARTPITAATGIMDEIEYILGKLPMGVPNDYTIS